MPLQGAGEEHTEDGGDQSRSRIMSALVQLGSSTEGRKGTCASRRVWRVGERGTAEALWKLTQGGDTEERQLTSSSPSSSSSSCSWSSSPSSSTCNDSFVAHPLLLLPLLLPLLARNRRGEDFGGEVDPASLTASARSRATDASSAASRGDETTSRCQPAHSTDIPTEQRGSTEEREGREERERTKLVFTRSAFS